MRLEIEVRTTTVAHAITNLHYAARLIDPKQDWQWLRDIGTRLGARGNRLDRFQRLVSPAMTLDYGIELMNGALDPAVTIPWRSRYLQYRDGLIIALLSIWPIRRRSLAALTVDRHLVLDDAGFSIRLAAADTKSKREERCRLSSELTPYLRRYLDEVRPKLLSGRNYAVLWPSNKGGAILGGRIYDVVRNRILQKFGKDMGLHDFRRSAATFMAIDMPEKIGLVPGVLQQASPEVGEQHYNLANATTASKRYAATVADIKAGLRSKFGPSGR
jgi:integrase